MIFPRAVSVLALATGCTAWPTKAPTISQSEMVIQYMAGSGEHRPHPFSTVASYTSWESLTDYTWYDRLMPAVSESYVDSLPPVGNVIDALFTRGSTAKMSTRSSMLFPTFAQHLVDSFIVSKYVENSPTRADYCKTETTHELALQPLYGHTSKQTRALRLQSSVSGQKGRFKSQMINGEEYAPFLYKNGEIDPQFADLDPPALFSTIFSHLKNPEEIRSKMFAFGGSRSNLNPQISAMNILFLREHNRIAGELEKRNPTWDDDRVFATAQNIVIVIYLKLVVEEYIVHISANGIQLRVEPSPAYWNAPWYKRNWLTIEFAILYRWHALVPDTLDLSVGTMSVADSLFNNPALISGGVEQTFIDMSAQQATSFETSNTADILLRLEANTLSKSRNCSVPPYADYVEYLGFPRPTKFSDISSNTTIQNKLSSMYSSVDQVEFYVGLIAEDHSKGAQGRTGAFGDTLSLLVGMDAFNQALTNPLLSENVFKEETFSSYGWDLINQEHTVSDLVKRNSAGNKGYVGMEWPPTSE